MALVLVQVLVKAKVIELAPVSAHSLVQVWVPH